MPYWLQRLWVGTVLDGGHTRLVDERGNNVAHIQPVKIVPVGRFVPVMRREGSEVTESLQAMLCAFTVTL